MFWAVGMLLGCGLGAAVGQSFVHEHGRRLIPLFVVLALGGGATLGWALNAWIDFVNLSASGTLRGS